MIELPVYDRAGKQVDTLSIDEAALGTEVRPVLLKQAYVMFHANRRQGSARTKSRGMVDGSTRKLYRQKGTGNARAGARRTSSARVVALRSRRPAPARTSARTCPRRCAGSPTATRCWPSLSTAR